MVQQRPEGVSPADWGTMMKAFNPDNTFEVEFIGGENKAVWQRREDEERKRKESKEEKAQESNEDAHVATEEAAELHQD
ncbi:uncharacterized protein LOC125037741 isoform X2 [Penaeus chinensis]|uniref:uncharacterized protein LOC125037741 isoform X2 n=1 Tax=Penaeus chinensis TaxID=139456 RepID=UPI001FB7385F|nr:uncharacterized protein LOC125037741 isoform X2 [Penaeus chinensis]